jgi:L-asparaginase
VEAYGAGNGPTDAWFLDPIRSALLATGAIPGGDMTFEAALTKLMVLVDRHDPDDVRRLMQVDLAGELTAESG